MTLERIFLKYKIKSHKKNRRNQKDLKNRRKLRKEISKRVICEGTIHTYSRMWWNFGYNSTNKIKIALQNVKINSKIKLTHLWVESIALLYFFKYDRVKFDALVSTYRKKNGELSYGLCDLKNIIKI